MISMIEDGAGQHDPGERRVEKEQERQEHASVIRSSNVDISLPVRNARTRWTWPSLYIVSPAGLRSK